MATEGDKGRQRELKNRKAVIGDKCEKEYTPELQTLLIEFPENIGETGCQKIQDGSHAIMIIILIFLTFLHVEKRRGMMRAFTSPTRKNIYLNNAIYSYWHHLCIGCYTIAFVLSL